MQVHHQLQPPTVCQTYAVSITNSSKQIIGTGIGRVSLSFHNPGTVDVYVCQAQDYSGTNLAASAAAAGMIKITAGTTMEVDLPGGGAWNGIAASSAVLTILEYMNPTRTT